MSEPERPALQWLEETVGLQKTGQSAEFVYSAREERSEWSLLRNLFFVDGCYQLVWRQFGVPDDYTIEFNLAATAGITNAQKVKWIFRRAADAQLDPEILVTTREVFVRSASGNYVNVTPLYTEGTSSCAGGTTAVVGTGTAWVTHRIKPGMLIRWPSVSATWFQISAVGTNTSITLTANGPNTGGSIAYEIRRCFGGDAKLSNDATGKNRLFCHVRNGDLYIAGNAVDGEFPAVLKVADVLANTAPLPADSTYILAQVALTTGHPTTAIVSTLNNIVGMQLSDDGRVVLSLWETLSGGGLAMNRARWSTPTLDNDWTGDGASFTDIPAAGDARSLTGLGRAGDTLAFHFDDSITLGRPTGQLTTPYDFSVSIGEAGCACPEVLCQFFGGDLYLGSNLTLYVFTGGSVEAVSRLVHDEVARFLAGQDVVPGDPDATPTSLLLQSSAMCFDGGVGSVHIFLNWDSSSLKVWGCRHLSFDMLAGRLTTADWPVPVSAAAAAIKIGRLFAAGFPSAYHDSGGLASGDLVRYCGPTPPNLFGRDTGAPQWDLPLLKTAQVTVIPSSLRTGWLNFGVPGYLKTAREIEIWAVNNTGGLSTTLTIAVESLPTNVNQLAAATPYPEIRTYTVPLRDWTQAGAPEGVAPLVNVARAQFDPGDVTDSNFQSAVGESLRFRVSGLPPGFVKLVIRATLDGPLAAVDSAG